jgi:hypothetical protein
MPSVMNPYFQNASAQKLAAARDATKAFLLANRETKSFTFADLKSGVPECETLTGEELARVAATLNLTVKP